MLTCRRYKSIHEIDPQHWDSILNEQDIFHRHSFISVVEDSRVENAGFSFLAMYDDEKLVSTTVFSSFNVSLDLFISSNRFVKALKKFFPGLFTIKILTCGLPASFGQLNLKIISDDYAGAVCSLIAEEMKGLAKKAGIGMMTIKEFRQEELKCFSRFEEEGFFTGCSIPYMNMDVKWKSFDEYLFSLRHPYRRKIILSLKKIWQLRPEIISAEDYDYRHTGPALILADAREDFAEEFYRKYLAVMSRTTTKLETLNLSFFKNLFRQKCNCKLLHLIADGKIISTAVLVFTSDALTFMLLARENETDEYDSYFNLVYAIIALAIQRGCKKIKMGQTAYHVKQCVGAMPEEEFIYFAGRRPLLHRLLKSLRHVIFPQTKLKPMNVFRTMEPVIKSETKHEQYHYSL